VRLALQARHFINHNMFDQFSITIDGVDAVRLQVPAQRRADEHLDLKLAGGRLIKLRTTGK
jgi:hypothetical protein